MDPTSLPDHHPDPASTRTARITSRMRPMHRPAAVAVAALAAIEIVRSYQAGDPRGIAAVAAIVGTTVALYLAAVGRDAADTLTTIATQAAAGVAALQAIERSLAEIEHTADLAEEAFDLLATTTASLTGLTSLDGGDAWARHTARSPDPTPAPGGGPDHG